MKFWCAFAVLFFASPASGAVADDWRYSIGVHDFIVSDVDSQTYGINAGVSIDKRTDGGRHVFGSFDIFLDYDSDHLDNDHIPIWWQLHLGSMETSGVVNECMSAGRPISTTGSIRWAPSSDSSLSFRRS